MLIRTSILIISVLIFSCSFKSDNQKSKNNRSPVVSIKEIYNYSNQLFDVSIGYDIPYNNFVFHRKKESFIASLNVTIQIFDTLNDSIVLQDSWSDEITVKSFTSTRSFKEYYSFERIESLPSGEFDLLINIQDLDNKNTINYKKTLLLSSDRGFGESIVYAKRNNNNLDFEVYEDLKPNQSLTDTDLRLLFQYFSDSTTTDTTTIDILNLKLTNNKNSIAKSYENLEMDEDGFYIVDFKLPDEYYGQINAEITVMDKSKIFTLFNYYGNNILWSDDIKEITGVMRYILSGAELKILNGMKDKEKIDYIVDFWKDKDPDLNTKENELLTEFINRFHFVNQNLSDVGNGWRSDRGRIYIIYGAPEDIEKYSSSDEGIYEIWTYPNGLKFTFLDRNRFGSYILVRQSL